MNTIATATLQTPWDCKWSRFGQMRSARPDARAEGLWVCVYPNGVRRPIDASECETCPYWEYESPIERTSQPRPDAPDQSAVAGCPGVSRAAKRVSFLLGAWGRFNRDMREESW